MNWEQIVIYKKDEVDALLTERGILDEDIKKVISQAIESGEKLYQEEENRFLAKAKLERFTVYVEYSPENDGFRIHTGYSHRVDFKSEHVE